MNRWTGIFVVLALSGCGGGADPAGQAALGASGLAQRLPARALRPEIAAALPSFDAATGMLSLPNVSAGGAMYGAAKLHREANGLFALVQEPQPDASAALSAASYAQGRLTLASVVAGDQRYTNARLDRRADGMFQLVALSEPLPVHATSYDNKNAIAFDTTQVPTVRALGVAPVHADEQDSNERSISFGDFFQEGAYSAFVMSTRAANLYGYPWVSDTPGVAYFLARDAGGQWVDRTSELLPSAADRSVCISASYSLVADFNNDGKPDVYVACNGVDFDLGLTDLAQQKQAYLSNQVLFLSQLDGTYRRVDVPWHIYGHKAAAGDIDGDGNIDVITTNQALGGERMPFVLRGHGDGTFTRDDAIVPANIFDLTGPWDGLYQVDLIPIANRLDAVFSSSSRTVWLKGNGHGGFDTASATTFAAATSAAFGTAYQMPLDIVFDAGRNAFYFHSTASHPQGTEWAILRYDMHGALQGVSELWNNQTATLQPYSAQFKPTADGFFVAFTGGCSSALNGGCGMKVPR